MKNLDSYKILIVDDFSVIRETLPKILAKYGFEAVAVSGGYEALAYLQANKVDMVITDISMPGMNGLDLLDEVKAKYNDLPVLVMSGDRGRHDKSRLDRAEAFLEKPFVIDEMLKIISACLDK